MQQTPPVGRKQEHSSERQQGRATWQRLMYAKHRWQSMLPSHKQWQGVQQQWLQAGAKGHIESGNEGAGLLPAPCKPADSAVPQEDLSHFVG